MAGKQQRYQLVVVSDGGKTYPVLDGILPLDHSDKIELLERWNESFPPGSIATRTPTPGSPSTLVYRHEHDTLALIPMGTDKT